MKRKMVMLAVLALAVATAAACSSSGSGGGSGGSSKSPINVLVVADQSGPNKTIGSQEALGVKAGAGYLNAQGGVLGRKVKVTVLDDNGDPTTASSLLIKAVAADPKKYSMVYPGEEGTIIASSIPILKRDRIYGVGVNDANSICVKASACPTQFSLTGKSSLTSESPASFFAAKKYTNVGVLAAQLDFTENEASNIKPLLTKSGIKFTSQTFPVSAVSVTSQMSQLRSAGAQAVYAAAFGAPIGYILKARAQLGWNVPVVFDVAGASFNIPALASSSELNSVYETAFRCMDPKSKLPALDLITKHAPTKQDGTVPCNQVAAGWDAMMVFANAAKAAKSVDSSALVKATERLQLSNTASTPLADYAKYCYSAANHENACQTGSDFVVVPVGKIENSRLAPLS